MRMPMIFSLLFRKFSVDFFMQLLIIVGIIRKGIELDLDGSKKFIVSEGGFEP